MMMTKKLDVLRHEDLKVKAGTDAAAGKVLFMAKVA